MSQGLLPLPQEFQGHGANRATFSQEGAGGAFIQSVMALTHSTMGAYRL
jgi:hypothetical protein